VEPLILIFAAFLASLVAALGLCAFAATASCTSFDAAIFWLRVWRFWQVCTFFAIEARQAGFHRAIFDLFAQVID